MAQRKFKMDIPNFAGLEYLTLTGVPMIETAHGDFMDVDPHHVEKIAAWVILTHELPIRGRELKLIRGALNLSMAKFARHFDKDPSTIMTWEKKPLERLSIADELLIRIFAADQMGIKLPSVVWKHILEIANKETTPFQVEYQKAA